MKSFSLLLALFYLALSQQSTYTVSIDTMSTSEFPPSFQIKLTLDGKDYTLNLEQNLKLFSPNYKLYEMGDDGIVVPSSHQPKLCHYVGKSDYPELTDVVVSICMGSVQGSFYFHNEKYIIEPNGKTINQHDIYKEKRSVRNGVCGGPLDPPKDRKRNIQESVEKKELNHHKRAVKQKKFVEYLVFNDRELATSYGSNVTDFTAAIVAQARQYYEKATNFNYLIEIVLIGQITLTASPPWVAPPLDGSGAINASTLLDSVTLYFSKGPTGYPAFDNVGIFSGTPFQSPTIGLAWTGTMCEVSTGLSSHVIDTTSFVISEIGSTVAHEMGHNFNMKHDTTACGNGYVMQSTLYSVPVSFSSCSTNYINTYFQTDSNILACLDNVPSASYDKKCGNGFVDLDKGEQCDCGSVANCDPCCNSTTCKLVSGAQCSSYDGNCCQNCKIVASGVLCRNATTSCETTTTCNGVDPTCPIKTLPEKTPCGKSGACYGNLCASVDSQCRAMTGFSENFEQCSYANPKGPCGNILCGVQGSNSNCFHLNDENGNDILVQDGVPCGVNQYCYKGTCAAGPPVTATATATGTGGSTPVSISNNSGKSYSILSMILLLAYMILN